MPSLLQRQARTASPPTPVGNTWLKNRPTNTIFNNVADPGESASADKMSCQRHPTTRFAINITARVAAIRGKLARLMSSAARPRSNRMASANISPAVTKSRMLVARILRMAVTPVSARSRINAGSAGPSQCLRTGRTEPHDRRFETYEDQAGRGLRLGHHLGDWARAARGLPTE